MTIPPTFGPCFLQGPRAMRPRVRTLFSSHRAHFHLHLDWLFSGWQYGECHARFICMRIGHAAIFPLLRFARSARSVADGPPSSNIVFLLLIRPFSGCMCVVCGTFSQKGAQFGVVVIRWGTLFGGAPLHFHCLNPHAHINGKGVHLQCHHLLVDLMVVSLHYHRLNGAIPCHHGMRLPINVGIPRMFCFIQSMPAIFGR